ncbi:MAG: 1-deoxy-D-xylulose-5-phosphate reductoisomerase [Eubacteriales bacterium]
MPEKTLTILGSTGSIGTQALQVASHLGHKINALAGHSNISLLEEQVRQYKPSLCAVYDETAARLLKIALSDTSVRIVSGMDGLIKAAVYPSDLLLNSVSGMIGLLPTLSAIEAGKDIAIANKETLVCCGELVIQSAKQHGVNIIPVDSEHCAIMQCLSGNNADYLDRIVLTASGGPFAGRTGESLWDVSVSQALAHPTWSMGRKISIDSATLMNKGLELIEAVWLFGLPQDKIDIVIHPQSIIHSMVSLRDGSVIAQLSNPDMRLCIQYAMTYPQRQAGLTRPLDLASIGTLSFKQPDTSTFTLIDTARRAVDAKGTSCAAMNGANEKAVELFLDGKIRFPHIAMLVDAAVADNQSVPSPTLEQVLDADRQAREFVLSESGKIK